MTKDRRATDEFDLGTVLTGRGPGQSRLQLPPEHVIYEQGDVADALFYIESGWVKMSAIVPSGKEPVIALRRADEFFGARSMIGARRQATATALTDCALVRVTKSALNQLLREQPDFAVTFAAALVRRSILDQESLIDHLTNSAEKRLARTLIQLSREGDGGNTPFIPAGINQALLAGMVGTTRSRVSVFLNKFKRQGLITYDRHGRVSVHQPALGAWLER
jgi:CRP/FNR family transcriptional regulator, cyclic AMP receptor protein